ncbi:MAG: methyltransferase domain-containing protein [Vibrio anguillarum]|nr:methyltransferase domain-containing protein [Vibrio anguillarum]MDT3848115.1 methyltransferase domain-containing protein [Vibrio anguillarum]NOI04656.1 class I SAM-dependent methyltransferase [Vibrio anguillarum]
MSKLKYLYDTVYSENDSYNFHYPAKDLIVDLYANKVSGRILDAGCGQGGNLKRLLDQDVDAFGVELSSVCCERHLSGLPHINSDIVSYANSVEEQFGGVICFDVLEHIPEESLDENLRALSSLSPSALLGIANHSDIQCGEELHLIQENAEWWTNRLKQYYKSAVCVVSFLNDTFFVIEVSNLNEGKIKLDENYRRLLSFSQEYDELWKLRSESELNNTLINSKNEKLSNQVSELKGEINKLRGNYSNILESREIKISNMIRKLFGQRIWE